MRRLFVKKFSPYAAAIFPEINFNRDDMGIGFFRPKGA